MKVVPYAGDCGIVSQVSSTMAPESSDLHPQHKQLMQSQELSDNARRLSPGMTARLVTAKAWTGQGDIDIQGHCSDSCFRTSFTASHHRLRHISASSEAMPILRIITNGDSQNDVMVLCQTMGRMLCVG